MDLVAVDWGTSRLRAFLVADGRVVARAESEDGVARLSPGGHRAALLALVGPWLEAGPALPVMMAGMVGSREGWRIAPYVACPAGARMIAAATVEVDLGGESRARIVPGLTAESRPGRVDVLRGEETLALGCGVADGLVCLPGTHAKWLVMEEGRIVRFATFMTGEMYELLRHQAMIGRPATEPADPAGFADGLAAAGERGGLLHLAFAARAAVVAGRADPARLGPHLSGLVLGREIAGARALFGAEAPTLVADRGQAARYAQALGLAPERAVAPEAALLAGLARLAAAGG